MTGYRLISPHVLSLFCSIEFWSENWIAALPVKKSSELSGICESQRLEVKDIFLLIREQRSRTLSMNTPDFVRITSSSKIERWKGFAGNQKNEGFITPFCKCKETLRNRLFMRFLRVLLFKSCQTRDYSIHYVKAQADICWERARKARGKDSAALFSGRRGPEQK